MTYSLVDINGKEVASGLAICVMFVLNFNRESFRTPSGKFEFCLYGYDSYGNEFLCLEEDGAKDFLMSMVNFLNDWKAANLRACRGY